MPAAKPRRTRLLSLLGPGMLVAATGVGAGDLLTAGLAGSRYGLALLWAAVVGAILKWFLNEGIARWQLATGTTLLEGWVTRLGRGASWVFLAYLLAWTLFTGGALINACGVAGAGLLPLGGDLRQAKIIWGAAHSFVGLALVWSGGFRLFQRVMATCIALMFVTVLATAFLAAPSWPGIAQGLIPHVPPGGVGYMLGILGGVGGTVTLLSYGYWIRETGRTGIVGMRTCRIDLAAGYTMTALFGVAMIVIGSRVRLTGGPSAALDLAGQLETQIGPAGRWIFLIGFWGAVFSSLLGVWQSVPYLFADFVRLHRRDRVPPADLERTAAYRLYLVAIAVIPLPLLWLTLERAQLSYAVLGAFFMPFLAVTLLLMNNRPRWVGGGFRARWATNAVLALTLAFFGWTALRVAIQNIGRL